MFRVEDQGLRGLVFHKGAGRSGLEGVRYWALSFGDSGQSMA